MQASIRVTTLQRQSTFVLQTGYVTLFKYFQIFFQGDMLSVDGDADTAVEVRIELDGINSGSWCHCLPIRIYH